MAGYFIQSEIISSSFFTSFESEEYSDSDYQVTDTNCTTPKSLDEDSDTISDNTSSAVEQSGTTDDTFTSNCPICLQNFQDRSYLNSCFHSFCVSCIRQWLNVTPTCPLCKSKVGFIIHNVDEAKGTFLKDYIVGNTEENEMYIKKSKLRKWIMEVSNNAKLDSKKHSSQSSMSLKTAKERVKIYSDNLLAKNIPQRLKPFVHFHNKDYDRLRPFLSRDLNAILNDSYDQVIEEYVQSIVVSYYQKYKSREVIIEKLKPWLGELTEKFLEEMFKFVESGLNIETWDQLVSYDCDEDLELVCEL
ncbi:11285_t:CDS:1 [Acaulospora colombiana]|uniref:11285_t:CDS:1 n=1 Tax=Acaulospora colombiana TaxID=27376 RepID=A0ACA9L1T8_9GLOM|nr:11285_t:CDS:1 [Acaulospora colombiana]